MSTVKDLAWLSGLLEGESTIIVVKVRTTKK